MRTTVTGLQISRGGSTAQSLSPSPIHRLNIIGGGSQNKLLNQLTANALGIPVYAGPVEATAMGEYPDSGNGERRNIQPPGNQRSSKPQCYTTSILP